MDAKRVRDVDGRNDYEWRWKQHFTLHGSGPWPLPASVVDVMRGDIESHIKITERLLEHNRELPNHSLCGADCILWHRFSRKPWLIPGKGWFFMSPPSVFILFPHPEPDGKPCVGCNISGLNRSGGASAFYSFELFKACNGAELSLYLISNNIY